MRAESHRYRYSPLAQHGACRILHLFPGKDSDPIVVRLQHASLDEELAFEALSSTWGCSDLTHTISCNRRSLPITASMYSALRRLRDPSTERLIWADGICINQADLQERSRQVGQMRRIYRQAKRVIIDLGDEADDSDAAVDLALQIVEARGFFKTSGGDMIGIFNAAGLPPLKDPAWTAFQHMLHRPWFSRIWVIQELAVSSDSLMLCGKRIFGGSVVFEALKLVAAQGLFSLDPRTYTDPEHNRRTTSTAKAASYIHQLYEIRARLRSSPKLSGLNLSLFLQRGIVFGATDPRDRIYAVLGLVLNEPEDDCDMRPDYNLDVADVYLRCFRYLIRHDQRMAMELLFSAGEPRSLSLPSWLPDWTTSSRSRSLEAFRVRTDDTSIQMFYQAATSYPPTLHLSDDLLTLTVRGVVFDTLKQVGRDIWKEIDQLNDEDMPERRMALREWIQESEALAQSATLMSESQYPDEDPEDLCWRTLICNLNHDDAQVYRQTTAEVKSSFLTHYLAFKELLGLEELLSFDDPVENVSATVSPRALLADSSVFLTAAAFLGRGRRMALSEKGFLGLVPSTCQPGDAVAVALGGAAPFFLRSNPSHETAATRNSGWKGGFSLVGHGYIHGLMHSEAVWRWGSKIQDFRII